MAISAALTSIVPRGHDFLAEIVKPGEWVVDLTAGTGQDCLALWRMVGCDGRVIAFDIQTSALDRTAALLVEHGACVRRAGCGDRPLAAQSGVDLVTDGHEHLNLYVAGEVAAVVANLGYLPGGDQSIITLPDTTLAALQQSVALLRCGGRLAVVVYPGHPGGQEEAEEVESFFATLDQDYMQVLKVQVANRPQAPFLFVGEKLRRLEGRDL